jgi:SAM-dependent methyltransferase
MPEAMTSNPGPEAARTPEDLQSLYRERFTDSGSYRDAVWEVLTRDFFQALIPPSARVLDVGCGRGGFINNVVAAERYAIDLNPDARGLLAPGVTCLEQSCAERWPIADGHLDWVFTSNFLEHLATKADLDATLQEAARCLRPGGGIICLGPNIRLVGGAYWDFYDHFIPLTERSLGERLTSLGFRVETARARFLPYTMVGARPLPLLLIRLYLRIPLAWRVFGKQFLVVARKV